MLKKHNYKVFNENILLLNLLFLLGIIYLSINISVWFLLFLILLIVVSLKIKINKWQLIFYVLVSAIFTILAVFAKNFSLFSLASKLTRSDTVRSKIFKFYDNTYNKEVSSFIKLILFGVRSKESYEFYKQTVDLGIVWLITTGGFHISVFSRIFKLMFKKAWKIGRWIDFSVLLILSFLLRFSYSSLKVVFLVGFERIFKKIELNRYNKIGFVGLLFCMLNPSCFKSYSFLLSFIGSISAYSVLNFGIQNKIINSLLINLFGFISTIPFVINFNNKISLLTFFCSFIFSYIFIFVFLYFLIFSWMPFMAIIHKYIMLGCYAIIGNISFLNIYIKSKQWAIYFWFAYYAGWYAIYKLLYLIVLNNKI